MRVFRSVRSSGHDPDWFFRRGGMIAHPENIKRFETLEAAVTSAGFALREPDDLSPSILEGVHDPAYVRFLQEAWDRRGEIDSEARELLTTQFARVQMNRRPAGLAGLLGYYMADTSTPIRAGTWEAIFGAAQAAAAAADAALADGTAYALCRPPGHHAFTDCAGGFCYLNNTAVAAERLRRGGAGKVAVLDIDVHHGNGTQGIFYTRSDVLTISVHADPNTYFPFFSGYADEKGAGEGLGFNFNFPLPHGVGDVEYLAAIAAGLSCIEAHKPDAIVVALGLDASEHDPIGVLKVTTEGFEAAAAVIAARAWPTVVVQEGGYLCDALPRNLLAFLKGVERARQCT